MQRPKLTIPAPLARHDEAIHCMLAPCFDLERAAEAPPRDSGTRLFGEPFLQHVGDWPRNPEGQPMGFLGQCDLGSLPGEIPELRGCLPGEGLLSLFWDLGQPAPGDQAEDRYRFRVLWTPRLAGGRYLAPPGGALRVEIPALPLVPRLRWRLPPESEAGFALGSLDDEAYGAYQRLCEATAPDCPHRLLGPADWLEGDARATCAAATAALWRSEPADWRLLWQVEGDGDLGLLLGGDFRIFVMIRDEDLRAARFLRAWVVVQGL